MIWLEQVARKKSTWEIFGYNFLKNQFRDYDWNIFSVLRSLLQRLKLLLLIEYPKIAFIPSDWFIHVSMCKLLQYTNLKIVGYPPIVVFFALIMKDNFLNLIHYLKCMGENSQKKQFNLIIRMIIVLFFFKSPFY